MRNSNLYALKLSMIVSFLMLLAGNDLEAQQDYTYRTPLVAARIHEIGYVEVDKKADSLDIEYVITDSNWTMTKTHLEVKPTLNGIPVNTYGAPSIQSFSLANDHESVFSVKYDNIDVGGWTNVYVSANANVSATVSCKTDTAILNASVPTGPLYQDIVLTGSPAYFNMFLYDFAGNPIYVGYYLGNCVDLDNPILEGYPYFPYAVSSYSSDTSLLKCLVDKPEHLDLVNYIINTDYKSKIGADGADVQAAIWTIIDDDNPVNGASGIFWKQSRVDYIINDAFAKGENYLPSCDGYFAVILDQGCKVGAPVSVQQSIFYLPVKTVPNAQKTTYGECTNAWGKGIKFSKTGWGMYFEPK